MFSCDSTVTLSYVEWHKPRATEVLKKLSESANTQREVIHFFFFDTLKSFGHRNEKNTEACREFQSLLERKND